MSRQTNPFDDILQPQPRHAQQPKLQNDPFGDDDEPVLLTDSAVYGAAVVGQGGSGGTHAASGSHDAGRQHGYALDPFFDE
jgi:hypothetical protein